MSDMSDRSQDKTPGAWSSSTVAAPHGAEGPVSLGQIFHINRSGRLLELVRHAERLARLNRAVAAYLPAGLKGHCTVANVREATLVLNASSPVWAARLRFVAPELLRHVQKRCPEEGMRAVRVRVSPALRKALEGMPEP